MCADQVLGSSHPDVARTRAARTVLAAEVAKLPETVGGFTLKGGKLTPQKELGERKRRPPDPRLAVLRSLETIVEHEAARPAATAGVCAEPQPGPAAAHHGQGVDEAEVPQPPPRLPRALVNRQLDLDCDDGTLVTVPAGQVLVLRAAPPGRFWFGYPEEHGPDYCGRFLRAPLATNVTLVKLLTDGSSSPRCVVQDSFLGPFSAVSALW